MRTRAGGTAPASSPTLLPGNVGNGFDFDEVIRIRKAGHDVHGAGWVVRAGRRLVADSRSNIANLNVLNGASTRFSVPGILPPHGLTISGAGGGYPAPTLVQPVMVWRFWGKMSIWVKNIFGKKKKL